MVETYDRKEHPGAARPLTNVTSYTYDSNGNRITMTEPLGWTTSSVTTTGQCHCQNQCAG